VSRAEAARLKNENLNLRKEVEELRARNSGALAEKTPAPPTAQKPGVMDKKTGRKTRSYVVRDGDTLASISRKFYKSSGRWKQILDANRHIVDDPGKLKAGQTLTIP
jgi:nucleoid-associated protein YgaU